MLMLRQTVSIEVPNEWTEEQMDALGDSLDDLELESLIPAFLRGHSVDEETIQQLTITIDRA